MVVFFTSWSRACQDELAALRALDEKDQGKAGILAVSFDKKSKELKTYLAKAGLSFPVLYDKKLTAIDPFEILIIPTTFCLNRDGVIEKIFVDYDDNVKKAVAEWLGS